MGLLLYGGLGLLPLWGLALYAVLAAPAAEPPAALLWWSVGAVPACFMTLMLAEAVVVARERRADPLRQQKILLIVASMGVLLYAAGLTWERQQADRLQEEGRIVRAVLADPSAAAWLGSGASARITLTQPNPDLTGAPLRYWVAAEGAAGRLRAVVEVDRRSALAPLTLACIEREPAPAARLTSPLRCPR